jgi:thymidylate synthase
MVAKTPMDEPRIHKCFPGGWQDLLDYVDEVVKGSRDHLADKLSYTYHDRLVNYPTCESATCYHYMEIDQLSKIVDILSKTPHSRRAQAITWIPGIDLGSEEPPCLQSLTFRIVSRRDVDVLDMHVRFRSRDAYNGAFMNMYALTFLQLEVADCLAVPVGHYVDFSDSFHVYGDRILEAEGKVKTINDRLNNPDGRSNYYTTEEFRSIWEEGEQVRK